MIETIEEQYNNNLNYLVKKNDNHNGLCYIYCSSNALYIKDNIEDFNNRILEMERYEWMNLRASNQPECEIFIRDVWLSWYVKGINKDINSYEKIINLLKNLTTGYKIRCIGASSGGFIGNILAMELKAECCYCFAGQFSLRYHFDHLQRNPFLNEYIKTNGDYWFEYYLRLNDADTKIIYIYPNQSAQDKEQYELVSDMDKLIPIEVNINEHGVAIYPFAIPRFLSYSIKEIIKLSKVGSVSKVKISIKIAGYLKFIKYIIKKMK